MEREGCGLKAGAPPLPQRSAEGESAAQRSVQRFAAPHNAVRFVGVFQAARRGHSIREAGERDGAGLNRFSGPRPSHASAAFCNLG